MLASYVVPLASGQINDPSGSLVAVAEGLLVEVVLVVLLLLAVLDVVL